MISLPSPSASYDAQNEAETRRSIEQAIAQLASNVPVKGGASVGGSGTAGTIPVWTGPATLGDGHITDGTRPTLGVESLAFLSDLFTQAEADARYSLLGHTHTTADITDFDSAGDARWVQQANFDTLGDARYFKLTDTALPGPLDIGDVTGMSPAMLRVGGKIGASDEVDALDFVLAGGAAGGGAAAALFSVSDEGTLLASSVASMNFVGAGVTASAVGDAITVTITFDQAAADARYLRSGIGSQVVPNIILSGNANPYVQFNDGTYNAYWQMASGSMQLYHNGATRINVTAAGGITITPFADVLFDGTRPITVSPGSGFVRIKGNAGGWADFYGFMGSSGTDRGGFGALGNADALTYYYVGVYGAEQVRVYPDDAFQVKSRIINMSAGGGPNWWQINNAASPDSMQLQFGTDNTGYALAIAKNVSGAVTTIARFYDGGSGTTSFVLYGSMESVGNITVANGASLYGRRNTGSAQVAFFRYDSGTDDLSTVLGGQWMRWRDTGSGVLMSLDASTGGALTVGGTIRSTSTYGLALGSIPGAPRVQYGSHAPDWFAFHNTSNGYAGLAVGGLAFATGPYFSDIGSANIISFRGNGTATGVAIYSPDGNLRGYQMYADTSGHGWLHSGGSWVLRNPYGTIDLVVGRNITASDFILA